MSWHLHPTPLWQKWDAPLIILVLPHCAKTVAHFPQMQLIEMQIHAMANQQSTITFLPLLTLHTPPQ